jgi:hypothetical protein
MAQSTMQPVTVRIERGRTITLYPITSILTPRTRALLRAVEKERRERTHPVHHQGRPDAAR